MRRVYLLESPLRRPRLVWAPTLVLALAAAGASCLLPPRYRAEALVGVAADPATDAALRAAGVDPLARRLQDLTRRVTDPELLRRVPQSEPEGLRVRPMASASYWIEFTHPDARTAALVPNTIAGLLAEESGEQTAGPADPGLVGRIEEARRVLQEKQAAVERASAAPAPSPAGRRRDVPTVSPQTDPKAVAERLELDDAIAAARARAARLRLAQAATPTPPPPSPQRELEAMRAQLVELQKRYTDEHPDVERLRARIARAEQALPATAVPEPTPTPAPSELRTVEREIEDLLARKAVLEARATRPAREAAPATPDPGRERERERLLLEQQQAQQAYELLLAESRAAGPAALASRAPVASVELLRPAAVPTAPLTPALPLVALAGALLGLVVGLVLAAVAEQRDLTVKGPEDLESVLPVPVLTTIPELRHPGRGRPA